MKPLTIYLTVEEVLELHKMLIEEFGGESGVRDLGLVESATHRPKSGYYKTLSIQAAALLHSFALNHVFVDGNKRVSFAATAIFLSMNGYKLIVAADEGENFMVQKVIQEKISLEEIAKWIEENIKLKN